MSQKRLNTAILWKALHSRRFYTNLKPRLLPALLGFFLCLILYIKALSFTQKSEIHLAAGKNN